MLFQRNTGCRCLRIVDQHINPSKSINRLFYNILNDGFIVNTGRYSRYNCWSYLSPSWSNASVLRSSATRLSKRAIRLVTIPMKATQPTSKSTPP